jgi:hypothetical protein
MKFNKSKNKKLKGYITLVVVIILTPFLLLQGINLVNTSIDILKISTSTTTRNKQYTQEQSCWEEILYFLKNNEELLGNREIKTPEIICKFNVSKIEENKYKITLETEKDSLYSFKEKYVFYDRENLKYIASQN